MSTPAALRGMVAVPHEAIKNMAPLGFITWFSVPDEDVPLRRLKRVWQVAGLDPASLPKDQKAVNAFKRAVRDQEKGERGNFRDPRTGYKVETDVRLLLENDEDVIYEVARVTRDPSTGVEYPKAVRVWFSKVTQDIGFKPLGGIPRTAVMRRLETDPPGIMDDITAAYEANASRVTGAKVRTLVRNYISDDAHAGQRNDKGDVVGYSYGLSGENMRGKAGGVYFVLHDAKGEHLRQLDSLAECLRELYEKTSKDAYLYYVPLANSKTARQMITDRQVANCMKEVRSEEAEVTFLLREERQRGVRENVREHHAVKLMKLRRRIATYQAALGEEQAELEARLGILERQLKRLAD